MAGGGMIWYASGWLVVAWLLVELMSWSAPRQGIQLKPVHVAWTVAAWPVLLLFLLVTKFSRRG